MSGGLPPGEAIRGRLCAAIPAFAQNPENLPVVGILRTNTSNTVENAAATTRLTR
jgi:hypothetical protein